MVQNETLYDFAASRTDLSSVGTRTLRFFIAEASGATVDGCQA